MLSTQKKQELYDNVIPRINALTQGESDWISILSTVVCELHNSFSYFDWTGFYRVTKPKQLSVGPYQGGHGCLTIPFSRGVCGSVAAKQAVIRLDDVESFGDHIACSSSTISEIVLPVFNNHNKLVAVLDIDSDSPSAFCQVDEENLSIICQSLIQFVPG